MHAFFFFKLVLSSLTSSPLCLTAMERREFGEEAAGSYGNIPALKHALYRIARDLDKVKGIAMYR